MVGTKDGRVVATQGDPDAEVNRGLNCIKGYFLSKIMYGADRVQTPLLRMKDGKFHKEGDFTPVSWDQAFTIMAEKIKDILRKRTKCCWDVLFRSNNHLRRLRKSKTLESRSSF